MRIQDAGRFYRAQPYSSGVTDYWQGAEEIRFIDAFPGCKLFIKKIGIRI